MGKNHTMADKKYPEVLLATRAKPVALQSYENWHRSKNGKGTPWAYSLLAISA